MFPFQNLRDYIWRDIKRIEKKRTTKITSYASKKKCILLAIESRFRFFVLKKTPYQQYKNLYIRVINKFCKPKEYIFNLIWLYCCPLRTCINFVTYYFISICSCCFFYRTEYIYKCIIYKNVCWYARIRQSTNCHN